MMGFVSLPTGKLHKKTETKILKNFPAAYVGRFYRDLAKNVDSAASSDFYGPIANDADIPSDDIQKYLLATTDFAKGMQNDINHYVTHERLNNASFRQKLDPISKNIFGRQNPLELVFQDISKFDAQNQIVGSLLKELDVGKKDLPSDLVKKAPPVGIDGVLQRRLNALRNDNFNFNSNNDDDQSPPPLPFNNFILPPPPSPTFNNFFPPPQLPPPSPPSPPSFFNHPTLFPKKKIKQRNLQQLALGSRQ